MKTEIFFTERQKFNQWWIWLILGFTYLMFFFILYIFLSKGELQKPDRTILIGFGIFNIVNTIIFLSFRLDTEIKSDGIYVRFFPIHLKFKRFSWEDLSKSYVRHYSPLLEYGGWGIRFTFSKRGKAYNISGDMGIQLEFNDSSRLLIGTNKPDEVKKILLEKGHLKE